MQEIQRQKIISQRVMILNKYLNIMHQMAMTKEVIGEFRENK
jgi:hypothetical protein